MLKNAKCLEYICYSYLIYNYKFQAKMRKAAIEKWSWLPKTTWTKFLMIKPLCRKSSNKALEISGN